MKKIVWCLILCTLFLFAGYTYAVTSSDAFDWALDAGLLTSYKTEYLKNEYLTREMVAPILVNFIDKPINFFIYRYRAINENKKAIKE